jgi:hypothetical protein
VRGPRSCRHDSDGRSPEHKPLLGRADRQTLPPATGVSGDLAPDADPAPRGEAGEPAAGASDGDAGVDAAGDVVMGAVDAAATDSGEAGGRWEPPGGATINVAAVARGLVFVSCSHQKVAFRTAACLSVCQKGGRSVTTQRRSCVSGAPVAVSAFFF